MRCWSSWQVISSRDEMRWVKLYDIRELPSWRNETARQMYMWLLLAAVDGGKWCSYRYAARALDITLSRARRALLLLERDGLIVKSGQNVTIVNQDDQQLTNEKAKSNGRKQVSSKRKATPAVAHSRSEFEGKF